LPTTTAKAAAPTTAASKSSSATPPAKTGRGRTFGDGYGEDGFALLAHFGTLGDAAQAVYLPEDTDLRHYLAKGK
jgi:hypothetical protein